MQTILFFNIKDWNVLLVKNYLNGLSGYVMRFGFSHIVIIFDELDKKFLSNSKKNFVL